jgi:hypothetical protein
MQGLQSVIYVKLTLFDTEPQRSHNPKCKYQAHSVQMKTNPDTDILNLKLKVQETLDELLSERLIPFALTGQRVSQNSIGEYMVPFYDSRLHSVRFCVKVGASFKEVFRAAVLDRVKSMSGPLLGWIEQPRRQSVAV